jgi:hypothetical protein
VEDEAVDADHQRDRLELEVGEALERGAEVCAEGVLAFEASVGAAGDLNRGGRDEDDVVAVVGEDALEVVAATRRPGSDLRLSRRS